MADSSEAEDARHLVPTPWDLDRDLKTCHGREASPENRERAAERLLEETERSLWQAEGLEDPALIWGWKLRGKSAAEAGAWHRCGVTPEEAQLLELGERRPADLATISLAMRAAARDMSLPFDRLMAWRKAFPAVTIAEIASWQEAGLSPMHAKPWLELGIPAAEAAAWRQARFNSVEELEVWRSRGFTPEDSIAMRAFGLGAEDAGLLRDAGIKPEGPEVAALGSLSEALRWLKQDVDLQTARDWVAGGFKASTAKPWLEAGFSAAEAEAWWNKDRGHGRFGFAASQALEWREADVDSVVEANHWRQAGVLPAKVDEWRELGFDLGSHPGLGRVGLAGLRSWSEQGVHDPEVILAAREARQSPSQLGPWLTAGLDVDAALAWRRSGVRVPERAKVLTEAGHDPESWSAPAPAMAAPREVPGFAVAVLYWGIPAARADETPWKGVETLDEWVQRFRLRASDDQTLESLGCRLGFSGRLSSYRLPYVAVVASEQRLRPPATHELRPVDPAWRAALEDFCEILGIPCEAPGWFLATVVQD